MLQIPYKKLTKVLPDFTVLHKYFSGSSHHSSQLLSTHSEVLRARFVKNLLRNNTVQVRLADGSFLTVAALSYDRINSLLILPEKAEQGLLLLDQGDVVEIFSALDESHEFFSFASRVVKTRLKGTELHYYMSVPKKLNKSRRRVMPRRKVTNHSIVRINSSFFAGELLDISWNGLAFNLRGYYPGELEADSMLENCSVDIFQPRINDNISFSCDVQIKRFEYHNQPERSTLIAGIYHRKDKSSQKKLLDYIVDGQ